MEYAELSCKTNFSFLEGASHPEEFIEQAAKLGLKALAITDKNGVYGIPKAYQAAKAYPKLKLIVGSELTLEDHPKLSLLVKDRAAYGVLCRMLTAAHAGKQKGEAALGWQQFVDFMQSSKSRGVLVLPDMQEATRYRELKDVLGERLYLPLMRFKDGKDQRRGAEAQRLRSKYAIPIVAVNDVHYHVAPRAKLQDVMTAIRVGKPLDKVGYQLFSNRERYLKSPQAMAKLFCDLPEAIDAGLSIADSCSFSPGELRYRYPSEWIPKEHTAQSYLEECTWKGAKKRYPEGVPEGVKKQVCHELELIEKLQFADYFLTIYDIVQFARQRNILCQGRGSAANSVVCYCLEITAIDPVRMNLLFERFVSAERGEPPDIDVDFEHERREEVIQHIYEKYGRDRAAMVSAVITYRKRSALREVSKAFGLEVGVLSAKKIDRLMPKLTKGDQGLQDAIVEVSEELKGFPRHLSIHSGGFTLSADAIIETVPVEPARMPGRTIIQWDKYDLDYIGLLKIDVLGIGMLSALHKALDLVDMQLEDIPADDKPTYAMIQRADTVGTFQIESRAQMSMLGRLLPKNFYDLVIQIAIVRPGPIVGKMVHPYLKRRRGEEEVVYYDPRVKKILEKTFGVPLFQEQVMQLAIDLAGFTPGEADELRRAIAAWRSTGSVEKMGRRLMQGLKASGLPESFAERVFDQIQGFSKYGFPESHAASFALIAYASCYLKCHYPAEFAASMVNSQPLGFYANHTLLDDAARHGVQVLPVHPNKSAWDCTIEDGAIRLGWRVVRGLSKGAAEKIMATREQRAFRNLTDFLARVELSTTVLERLAMGDAFITFGYDQRHSLWHILEYQRMYKTKEVLQRELLAHEPQDTQSTLFDSMTLMESVFEDYNSFDLSTHGHPMQPLRKIYATLPRLTAKEARDSKNGSWVSIAGLIIAKQRPSTAKGMMFCTLEDETGFLDVAVQPPIFERYSDILLHHCFVEVRGILQRDQYSVSLLVRSLKPIFREPYMEKQNLYIEPSKYFQ